VQTLQEPTAQVERTLLVNTTYRISYPDGSPVTAAVNATADVILAGQRLISVPLVIMNSTSGEWKTTWTPPASANTATYHFQFNPANLTDPYGNKGKGVPVISSDFKVIPASLTFQPQIPMTTERTTALNLTNTVYYPDGSTLNSTVTLEISAGNQTWTPNLSYDSTNGIWSGSLYLVQNATLGQYNITWAAHDPYGNARNITYTTLVVPARFSFVVETNSTVNALSNLDLPVLVTYPNGSSLTNSFGNVTGSYENSTRYVFTLPLAYNSTNGTWHMFFFVPQQANATLSFNATDRFGNSAMVKDAYNLKIASIPIRIQNLIIAAVIGALIPIGLLIWAMATISTRKRKHRP
jgi:hypothetical protein